MAKVIPPKKFYKLSQPEQIKYAVAQMNAAYSDAEQWKKVAQQARKKAIIEPDERPDEVLLKDESN